MSTSAAALHPKRVAILQSNYIPWKGYFDIVAGVDEFIILDEVQYTKNDWRNRNCIKTNAGTTWLTIPVDVRGHLSRAINEIRVADTRWARKHWNSLVTYYAKARHFKDYRDAIEALYVSRTDDLLSEINHRFITALCDLLGISTKITWSTDYEPVEGRTARLVSLCQQAGATTYLTGPSAWNYLDASLFDAAGLKIETMSYAGYPEYRQLYPPFEHRVSVLDLLFNEGPRARDYMLCRGDKATTVPDAR